MARIDLLESAAQASAHSSSGRSRSSSCERTRGLRASRGVGRRATAPRPTRARRHERWARLATVVEYAAPLLVTGGDARRVEGQARAPTRTSEADAAAADDPRHGPSAPCEPRASPSTAAADRHLHVYRKQGRLPAGLPAARRDGAQATAGGGSSKARTSCGPAERRRYVRPNHLRMAQVGNARAGLHRKSADSD